jgi:SAM-dependent methyltransferase
LEIKINLGSGDQRLPGYIGLDRLPLKGVDILCDLNLPLPLTTACASDVYAKSVLEHISDLEGLLAEIERILAPGGHLVVYVPHWSNPFFYSDYTHKRFFGLASFDYLVPQEAQFYRKVPVYREFGFRIISVRLIFQSPFGLLNALSKGLQMVVNSSRALQVFYEFHMAPIIPCYAVEYIVQRK